MDLDLLSTEEISCSETYCSEARGRAEIEATSSSIVRDFHASYVISEFHLHL